MGEAITPAEPTIPLSGGGTGYVPRLNGMDLSPATPDELNRAAANPVKPSPEVARVLPKGVPPPSVSEVLGQRPTAEEILNPNQPYAMERALQGSPLDGQLWDYLAAHSGFGRILTAFGHGLKQGWGTSNLGFDPETEAGLKKSGILPDMEKGQGGIVRAINEGILRPLAVAVDTAARAGSAAFSGGQAAVAQAGAEAGAPLLGRDIAAMPEAFFGQPGALHTPRAPLSHPEITEAQRLGVIGAGEEGWQGTKEIVPVEPEEAIAPSVAEAQREAEAAAPHGLPEPQRLALPAPEPPRPPVDVHEAARRIAPDTFREYDELGQQKSDLQASIADKQAELRRQAEAQAPHSAEIADLHRRLEDTTPRLAKKYQARLAVIEPEHDAFLADEFTMGALTSDTDEIASLREQLQQTDYRMRDLSPDVTAAYRDAAKLFPEPEPVAPLVHVAAPEAAATPPEAAEPSPVSPAELAAEPAQVAPQPAERPAPAQAVPLNIADDASRKLVAAGRPEDEAQAAGALLQAHYEARAARFGGALGSAEDLYRAEGPEIRGAATGGRQGAAAGKAFIKDARTVITLFGKADASTFLHETGHQWLEELFRDAGNELAPPDLKADAAAVRDWLGVKEAVPERAPAEMFQGQPEGGFAYLTRRQHEQFARGFEQYLMEGRAPSRGLARVFDQFRAWLTVIYSTARRLGRPITDDIRDVFDRLIAHQPEPREPVIAPEREPFREESMPNVKRYPLESVPKEPTRLVAFLRKMGGVRDDGGDIAHMLGGSKYRPGLISTTGLPLDEAALRAWESGYFPELGEERPTTNDLLNAIDEDLRGNARYSHHDAEAVARREDALAHNAEIQRIADEFNINPSGMSRAEFADRIAEAMSQEQMRREQESLDHSLADQGRELADAAKDYVEDSGEAWHPDEFYGKMPPPEDLESEQHSAAQRAGPVVEGQAGAGQSSAAGGPARQGQEGGRYGGGAADAGRRGEAENPAGASATGPAGGNEAPAAGAAGRRRGESAERPAGPNEPFREPANELIDKAGNIRLDNLNAPEDVNAVLRQFAAEHADYEDARRGVVPDADVISLADALGATAGELNIEKLRQMSVDDPFPFAARVRAGRLMLVQAATAMREAMAKAANGSDADVMAFVQASDRLNMIQETVSGVTAEWGRAGRAFRQLKPEAAEAEALANIAQQTTGKTLFQLQEMAKLGAKLETPAQVAKFSREAMTQTRWQKIKAGIISYFVNGLISGPITHGAYGIGNTVLALYKAVPETLAQAAVGEVRHAITGSEDRVRFGEAGAQLYGMVRGLRDGFVPGMKAFKSGVFVPLNEGAQANFLAALPRQQAIPGRLGYALETPGRVVTMIHTLFYTMGYEQEVARLAYRDAANSGLSGDAFNQRIAELTQAPTPQMMDAAHNEAMRMVLMQRPKYGSTRYHLTQAVNKNLLAKLVMPFLQIGTNILEQGIVERTPLALLQGEARAELLGQRGAAARDLRLGKILAGSMLATLPVGLAAEGIITGGGPVDPNKRRVLEESGWKPYSIKWGDVYVPYRKYLGPLGPLVAASTDIYEVGHIMSGDGLAKASASLAFGFGEVVADETWMSGLSNFIEAAHNWDTKGARYMRGLATSFIPFSSLQRQTARLVDPYQRDARTLLDAARNNIPFASEGLEPQISIWGQPIPSHQMISPTFAKNDPVDDRLIALDMGVTRPERKVRGVALNAQQYTDYQKIAGRMTKMRLDALIATPGFSLLPNGMQQRVVKDTVTNSRETARNILMMRNPDIIRQALQAKQAQAAGLLH